MIESICFKNFKALRDTTLPLGRCTLIVGPNGSGKSTALQAFAALQDPAAFPPERIINAHARQEDEVQARVVAVWGDGAKADACWYVSGGKSGVRNTRIVLAANDMGGTAASRHYQKLLSTVRVYTLDAGRIATPCTLSPGFELGVDGFGLAGALDHLRDHEPERFEQLNEEFSRWLPEFDRVLFQVPKQGCRSLSLRTTRGRHEIPAAELSQGTLLSLAILTIAYLPEPPPVIGLEEPDHGIHPRLLRQVADAIYRLSHPESCGEKREPVQIVMTTHSPYFLDLFKDHPEEIVIAEKDKAGVHFHRLSDHPRIEEILGDAPLGEIWYSGVLGGVPVEP